MNKPKFRFSKKRRPPEVIAFSSSLIYGSCLSLDGHDILLMSSLNNELIFVTVSNSTTFHFPVNPTEMLCATISSNVGYNITEITQQKVAEGRNICKTRKKSAL